MSNTTEQVYTLTLRDMFSGGVDNAASAASHLREVMGEVALAVGVAFSVEKILEFGKEILHTTAEFEGFTNVIKYASIDMQDVQANVAYLEDAVKRLHLPLQQAFEQFSELQGGLYGTGVEGDKLRNIFEGLGTASAVLHLNADQFSRAGYALKEVGELGELQTRQMRMLAMALPGSMNLAAEAMGMSTEELHKAMEAREIKAGPFMERFGAKLKEHFSAGLANAGDSLISKMNDTQSEFLRLQLEMGETLRPMYIAIMDGVIKLYHALENAWKWLVEHKETIKALAVGVGVAVTAYGAYVTIMAVSRVLTMEMTIAQWAMNAAMNANPVGIVITGLALLSAGIYSAWQHSAKFRATILALWEVMKAWAADMKEILTGIWEIIHGIFTMNASEVTTGLMKVVDVYKTAGTDMADAWKKGWNEGMKDLPAGPAAAHAASTATPTGKGKPKTGAETVGTGKAETAKGTGSKNVTINIKIDNLVREFQVRTTNMVESARKAREAVAQALLSAVNDSQIVAGQ